ncbi:heme ABC exporter ATP-binding protein CcmA [Nocardioides luteus]|uniref:Heme ABC exporter, ATP-binding protein CcmA n=1 Tax=Nocardioides luteus TaxID=1844 RepID=A0A1J4ND75_9ACTN|nr:heme ABC exporter ATP-binding protein CcmA [Nocardioides luteus]OIJ28560.1 heme ABC exporter, ATP-binding protein CcmA [Nocardioides luteus]
MNNVVEASGLRVVRGKREVLHGLDFSIRAGEVTGLLGPSGCGKTTLMRALVGVQAKVTGSLTVLGRPAGAAALRPKIGYVTQEASVYEDLTVTENLKFFTRVLGAPRSAVSDAIETVDLIDHKDQVVRDLSGGQRSRVGLAAALLGSPELLVLDEPTVGLDPVLREQLWGTFRDLATAGVGVIVSSHVMDEAERCDRLLLMRDGAFLADGSPAEIKQKASADDIEHAFLALVRGAVR